jgi:two-component system cell cycle sensor histidine kinase PleC
VAGQKGELCLVIADNGIGMDAATKDNALKIFGRGDQPMTRKIEGVGLGLHLSNAIVEAHGGTLTIESTLGMGTSVEIFLPSTAAP